jgi:cell division protein ZapE
LNHLYKSWINHETNMNLNTKNATISRFLSFLKNDNEKRIEPKIKGAYLYGGVGCGKTMLMDMTFDSLNALKRGTNSRQLRIHFNKFMLNIHEDIHKLRSLANPLITIADQLSQKYKIIFFDEFQVTDIADAMLMSSLFTQLFKVFLKMIFNSFFLLLKLI